MPVLPEVASSRDLSLEPGVSWPWRMASATMADAARSFTLPPGLVHSALPGIWAAGFWVRPSIGNRGGLPVGREGGGPKGFGRAGGDFPFFFRTVALSR